MEKYNELMNELNSIITKYDVGNVKIRELIFEKHLKFPNSDEKIINGGIEQAKGNTDIEVLMCRIIWNSDTGNWVEVCD